MLNRALLTTPAVAAALLLSSSSNLAEPSACRAPEETLAVLDEPYPAHALSPMQALDTFDVVFHAEVLVPNRSCSLGYCAGLRIIRRIKGDPGGSHNNVLIQSMRLDERASAPCGPQVFAKKGARWMVFANRGTTKGGLTFLHAEDDGPSFRTTTVPAFDQLEASHRLLRGRLDQAISEQLGRRHAIR